MSFAKRSAGVNMNTKEYDKRMDIVYRGLGSRGLTAIGRATIKLLDRSAEASISSAKSPAGVPWRTRKVSQSWAPLQKTGQLKKSMKSTFKSSKTKVTIKAAVKPGLRSGGKHKRRHGQVAAFMHYGRIPGVGKDGRSYGSTAARRFLGLTRSGYSAVTKLADSVLGKG